MGKLKDCENAILGDNYDQIGSRYREICDVFFGGKITKMSEALGLEYSNLICHIKGTKSYPKYHIKVLEVMPNINAQWFFFGRGEMEVQKERVRDNTPSAEYLTLLDRYEKALDEISRLRALIPQEKEGKKILA